ncbi:MAG: hypothetical protein RSB71_02125 [Bacilli bacterium]
MNRLSSLLREVGISKVKLAKFLGVSRQMIYNYLELDSIDKWPKNKKVLLLNLLGIKSSEDLIKIKVTTDYIYEVDARLNSLAIKANKNSSDIFYEGLGKKQKTLLQDVLELLKERLEDDKDDEGYNIILYLYHFLQSIESSKELKYILGYVSKATGFTQPSEFVFDKDEQFIFESILFSAFSLYEGGGASKSKLASSHERFVAQIEHKIEEKMSRTLELNTIKVQALKELGYTTITEQNAAEIFEKIAEIQSRKVTN